MTMDRRGFLGSLLAIPALARAAMEERRKWEPATDDSVRPDHRVGPPPGTPGTCVFRTEGGDLTMWVEELRVTSESAAYSTADGEIHHMAGLKGLELEVVGLPKNGLPPGIAELGELTLYDQNGGSYVTDAQVTSVAWEVGGMHRVAFCAMGHVNWMPPHPNNRCTT